MVVKNTLEKKLLFIHENWAEHYFGYAQNAKRAGIDSLQKMEKYIKLLRTLCIN